MSAATISRLTPPRLDESNIEHLSYLGESPVAKARMATTRHCGLRNTILILLRSGHTDRRLVLLAKSFTPPATCQLAATNSVGDEEGEA